MFFKCLVRATAYLKPSKLRELNWMKGMLFPLDLIWIENGLVVHIERDAPHFPPGTSDMSLPIYAPSAPATYVLEVNAGFTAYHGIEVGSQVELIGV